MTIPHYGVWVGRPIRIKVDSPSDKTPHIELFYKDDLNGSKQLRAAINVKSQSQDSRLVYWFDQSFSHPLTDELAQLEYGFQLIRPNDAATSGLAIDFVRADPKLLELKDGRILPYNLPGKDNDILDQLVPILKDAISQQADIFLFGSSFGSGIHDVHMNQGSAGFENGVAQDGAILLRFPDGHWEAVFLAFASQCVPTDDSTGEPLSDSTPLSDIAHGHGTEVQAHL